MFVISEQLDRAWESRRQLLMTPATSLLKAVGVWEGWESKVIGVWEGWESKVMGVGEVRSQRSWGKWEAGSQG